VREEILNKANKNISLYLPHMLKIKWNYDYGWDHNPPKFTLLHNLQIHPASKVIKRALEVKKIKFFL
jgi:hypothetical protein